MQPEKLIRRMAPEPRPAARYISRVIFLPVWPIVYLAPRPSPRFVKPMPEDVPPAGQPLTTRTPRPGRTALRAGRAAAVAQRRADRQRRRPAAGEQRPAQGDQRHDCHRGGFATSTSRGHRVDKVPAPHLPSDLTTAISRQAVSGSRAIPLADESVLGNVGIPGIAHSIVAVVATISAPGLLGLTPADECQIRVSG